MANEAKLGGRSLTRIGLGTNRLTDTDQRHAFLRQAVDAGIEFIDTAHVYTGGESERAIGNALAPFRQAVLVATKAGYGAGTGHPDRLRDQIEQSFRSLRTETIDLHYLHRVDPEVQLEESVGVLARYREEGRVTNVGLSEVGIEEIERAREVAPIAAVQNQYNLGERKWDPVVDFCEREGILFVPFYPLRGITDAANRIAERRGVTPRQIALAWLLHRSPAIAPIPGTLSVEHVRENLAALEIELTDVEFGELSAFAYR